MLAVEKSESECLIIHSRSLLYLEMIRFIVSIVFRVEKKTLFSFFSAKGHAGTLWLLNVNL